MIPIKQLKASYTKLSSIVTTMQDVKEAYDDLQLDGILKPNLHKEFYDLHTELCGFTDALARLIDKSEGNDNE